MYRRKTWFLIIVIMFFGMLGLSECKKEKAEEAAAPAEKESTQVYPKAFGRAGLSRGIMDTLIIKKKKFNITRDEYWEETGGVLASEEFEVWYPPGLVTVTHGMYMFDWLKRGKIYFRRAFGSVPDKKLVSICTEDLADYKNRAGREWWYYSDIRGDTLIFQPIYIIHRRGLTEMAVPHEYHQWAIRTLSNGKAPRWLEEGLASLYSEEGNLVRDQLLEFKKDNLEMTFEEIESVLRDEKERQPTRIAYYHAFKMVETLSAKFGNEKLVELVKALAQAENIEDAFMSTFQMSYADVIKIAKNYTVHKFE